MKKGKRQAWDKVDAGLEEICSGKEICGVSLARLHDRQKEVRSNRLGRNGGGALGGYRGAFHKLTARRKS